MKLQPRNTAGYRWILWGALAGLAGAALAAYTRYTRREMARLRSGSRIVPTRCGPVEAAIVGKGPPVLVIHGSTGGYNLGLYLAWPESGFQYIVPSRPGFLRTPLQSGPSPEEEADLMAALLDALGIERAGVIALSGVRSQTFQLALRHPERIRALVIVSMFSRPVPLWLLAFRVVRTLLKYSPLVPALLLRRTPRSPLLPARLKAAIASSPDRIEEMRSLPSVVFPFLPRMAGMINDTIWITRPTAEPVHTIQVPTLVIHGDLDKVVPVEQAEYLVSQIQGAELHVIESGDHLAFAAFNDEVRQAALGFLRRTMFPEKDGRIAPGE